jgi:DNA-binding MarR family transcriptional regulator
VVSSRQRHEVVEALSEVTRFVVRQTAALGEASLTAAVTLGTLASGGPRRITELAESGGVSQPSMTALVTRLEREGLVTRRGDPTDGRIVLVVITEAGRAVLHRRSTSRLAFLSSVIDELPARQQQALADAVEALRRLVDPAAVPAAQAAARAAVAGLAEERNEGVR